MWKSVKARPISAKSEILSAVCREGDDNRVYSLTGELAIDEILHLQGLEKRR